MRDYSLMAKNARAPTTKPLENATGKGKQTHLSSKKHKVFIIVDFMTDRHRFCLLATVDSIVEYQTGTLPEISPQIYLELPYPNWCFCCLVNCINKCISKIINSIDRFDFLYNKQGQNQWLKQATEPTA